ncbi:MAG: hypothetical protein PHN56_03930 [Candidatus Nanoarchaeia archaeon]|nr:hypothetical protein [Candidatus Nanoarchaeia archaeon]
MPNFVKNDYVTLDGTFLKSRPSSFKVKNLRQEQLNQINAYEQLSEEEKEYKMSKLTLGDLGWISPKNMIEYYCFKCDKNYSSNPVMKIYITDDSNYVDGNLFCNVCNEVISIVITEKTDLLIEKEYVEHDETGIFKKFTNEFINQEINREIRLYELSPFNISCFFKKINSWIDKAKTIDYIVQKESVYCKLKKEVIEKSIKSINPENSTCNYYIFSYMNSIIKARDDSFKFKKMLKEQLVEFKQKAEKDTNSLIELLAKRQNLGVDEKTDLTAESNSLKKDIEEILNFNIINL